MSEWVDLAESLPGLRGLILHVFEAADEPRVRAVLESARFDVRVIEGARVVDEDSFFEQVRVTLPLRDYDDNWDAFNDGMCDLCGRVAVLWRDADQTFAHDAQTLLLGLQGLWDAALEPARDHGQEPLQLEVFVFGVAAGFKSPK